jgi:predicted transcriptional regulator
MILANSTLYADHSNFKSITSASNTQLDNNLKRLPFADSEQCLATTNGLRILNLVSQKTYSPAQLSAITFILPLDCHEEIKKLQNDGLVIFRKQSSMVVISQKGQKFLRNFNFVASYKVSVQQRAILECMNDGAWSAKSLGQATNLRRQELLNSLESLVSQKLVLMRNDCTPDGIFIVRSRKAKDYLDKLLSIKK